MALRFKSWLVRSTEARRYVAMLYSNALELAAAKPPFRCRRDSNAAINRIERVINADAGRWNGRAGATNLAILHAQLKIMRRCGALKHGTGSREVALLAGVNSIQPCVQLIKGSRAPATCDA